MSGSVNKVILVGNLGKDPEVRRMQSGDAVVNLRLATTESWRDKASGERKEKTEWHAVTIFNENLGKVAEQYLKKGSKVYIEGQLQTRKFTDKDGVEKYTTEVVLQRFRGELTMLEGRNASGGGSFAGDDDRGAIGTGGNGGGGGERASFGRASPMDRGGNAGGGSGGSGRGGSMSDAIDDDIPF